MKWWSKTLSSVATKGWYFVPGESQATVRDIGANLTKDWSFGWPWPNHLKASEVCCARTHSLQVIPKFSDDAKVKALELVGPEGTIADFSEILSVTGECGSGRFSGFFILDLEGPSEANYSTTLLSESDFDALETLMLSGSFETMQDARAASRKVLDWLKERDARLSSVCEKISHEQSSKAQEDLKRPIVQDISSLVKRKKPKI